MVLHVRALNGERVQVRCGKGENFNPRGWQWSRNSLATFVRGDPQGYVSFTEEGGRHYRFAVPTEEQMVQFKAVVHSPVA